MKQQIGQQMRAGFTLIELVIVMVIIGILAGIAIGKFSDIRKESARKANVANIKNITRTINTELVRKDGESIKGTFAYAESLIDVDGKKVPTGAAGTYLWKTAWYDGAGGVVPGIYCGIKLSTVVENAEGVTTGEIADLATAHENNTGLDSFAASLGMHYLNEKEVSALKEAGVSIVSYHNYSNAQSKNLNWSSSVWASETWGLHSTGGGPGMRPDLSACFPVVLTNGMPVAVINPATCSSIYRDLGLTYGTTEGVSGLSTEQPETYFTKGICKRLIVIGLGRDCEATTKFFENAPRCPTLPRTRYRNYLLVFQMNNGQGNEGVTTTFVGVIDPAGNTAKQAQYDADWSA